MEKKSSVKTKPKTKRGRFNSNIAKPERVRLAEDLNGCVLVIPEISEMNEHTAFYQWSFPQYHV